VPWNAIALVEPSEATVQLVMLIQRLPELPSGPIPSWW